MDATYGNNSPLKNGIASTQPFLGFGLVSL